MAEDVAQEFNNAGFQTNVFITSESENATYATSLIEDEELVVCAGGDGTLKQVVAGIMQNRKDVKIGYIPCGSTNDFASTIGLSKNIKTAVKNIINGETHLYDVGEFCNTAQTYINIAIDNFVYVASFGLFSSASYNTPQNVKNNFGSMAYVLNGLAELIQAKSYKVKIKTEHEEVDDEYILGMVANTLSIGGVIKLDPTDVDLSDGLFEILLIKKPKTLIEFNEIVDGIANKNFSGKMFYYKKAEHVSLWFDEKIKWSLDGEESAEANFFQIDNLGQKLKLIK